MTGICVVTIICFLKGKKGFVHDMIRPKPLTVYTCVFLKECQAQIFSGTRCKEIPKVNIFTHLCLEPT